MKLKVTEQGVLIPKELFGDNQEVEIIQDAEKIIITASFLPTEDYLQGLIEKEPQPEQQLTPEQRVQNWLSFIETLPKQSANLPDEALHRDTMYDRVKN